MWFNLGHSRKGDSWELLNIGPHFNHHSSFIRSRDCLMYFVLQSKWKINYLFRDCFLQWWTEWNQRGDMQKSLIQDLCLSNSLFKPWWFMKINQKANDDYFYLRWKARSKFWVLLRCHVLFIALEISYQLKASPEVHREARPSFSVFH